MPPPPPPPFPLHPTVIIGAGISGLATASHLLLFNHPVIVLEKSRCVGGRIAGREPIIEGDTPIVTTKSILSSPAPPTRDCVTYIGGSESGKQKSRQEHLAHCAPTRTPLAQQKGVQSKVVSTRPPHGPSLSLNPHRFYPCSFVPVHCTCALYLWHLWHLRPMLTSCLRRLRRSFCGTYTTATTAERDIDVA